MKRTFEFWQHFGSGVGDVTGSTADRIKEMRAQGLIPPDAKLLYQIEADTLEEAMSIHNLRMGWGPYKPEGDPEPCPKCGSWFYPKGSGDCWKCGNIC